MDYIKLSKISYAVSGALVFASFAALFLWGLPLGIDFIGGSLMELEFADSAPEQSIVHERIAPLELGDVQIQRSGEKGLLLRMRDINEDTHQRMLAVLRAPDTEFTEKQFVSIGPVIGNELTKKALWALLLVLVMIVAYIALVFRHVSRPLSSWKYGIVAIIALVHDVAIPIGLFVFLGKFYQVEISALFVSALLTILGFSVHDTIVVFDRIRENLQKRRGGSFEETINISIHETVARSINTSLTLLLVLLTLFFFGGESTKYFSLALIVGTVVGVYSSIFIASPLLATWHQWSLGRNK
ncbi:MAG: protein translocase subunit SecF [Patescibacteria group bacterium]